MVTGLGFIIAHGIIKKLCGNINVDSNENVFEVKLPGSITPNEGGGDE